MIFPALTLWCFHSSQTLFQWFQQSQFYLKRMDLLSTPFFLSYKYQMFKSGPFRKEKKSKSYCKTHYIRKPSLAIGVTSYFWTLSLSELWASRHFKLFLRFCLLGTEKVGAREGPQRGEVWCLGQCYFLLNLIFFKSGMIESQQNARMLNVYFMDF